MSGLKGTPGPWSAELTDTPYAEIGESWVVDAEAGSVCTLDSPLSSREANAKLIASAPDLLEALLDILGPLKVCSDNRNVPDHVTLPTDMTMGELRKARAAISRALGEGEKA